MRISRPFVVGVLFASVLTTMGFITPVNTWAVDVLSMDLLLWTNAIRGASQAPLTLANPWTEPKVQRYLKAAREQFPPAGPLARETFVAWEKGNFFGAAGQGRTTTRSRAHKTLTTGCCSVCCLY